MQGKSRSKLIFRSSVAVVLIVVMAIYFANASWLAPSPEGRPLLLAHRGVHQLYDRAGLDKESCTATRIFPPTNRLLENTIPSIAASFDRGADILEIDIHPTRDGDFAVFHDWTLDCRTNGTGVTRDHSMPELKALDIGWGYTADGGKSYPFRGEGIGMMPSLSEILEAFPDRRFLLNIKSRSSREAEQLFAYLTAHDIDIGRQIMVYGHERPIRVWRELTSDGWAFSKASLKSCTIAYEKLGWSGSVPSECKDGAIAVPIAWRNFYWGWPNRFLQRMSASNTQVILLGDVQSENGAPGITDPADLAAIPHGFRGIIWTDSIEEVGPAWKKLRPGTDHATSAGN